MSLRIYRAGEPGLESKVSGARELGLESKADTPLPNSLDSQSNAPDGWASRLAKLIPAEALGLYGIASAQVPTAGSDFTSGARVVTLWVVALICLGFSAAIRIRATAEGGKPQWTAVVISVISFLVWLVALGPPGSPVKLPNGYLFIGPLVAVIWATLISFYRGDPV